jgi:hypothetical protein
MENPFSYSDYVTGEAFCNRAKEQKDLIYYAQNSQNVLVYSYTSLKKRNQRSNLFISIFTAAWTKIILLTLS